MVTQVIFYVFATVAVLSGLMAVTQNNPVRSVLFLVLTFFAASVLWILMHAEFLALILVLVYVGAVMTLFLFVVMMLNIDIESAKHQFLRFVPLVLLLVGFLLAVLLAAIPKSQLEEPQKIHFADTAFAHTTSPQIKAMNNTKALGMVLYTDYVYAFEIAAVLLLVSIVSAITLVHNPTRNSKRQDIKRQIMTRRSDRITLVNIHPESKR